MNNNDIFLCKQNAVVDRNKVIEVINACKSTEIKHEYDCGSAEIIDAINNLTDKDAQLFNATIKKLRKLQFYYIGKDDYVNRNKPFETFEAIKLKENNKFVFYPIMDRINGEIFDGNKWRSSNVKTYNIPVYSGQVGDFVNYRKKYGDYCLYYSLTGCYLYSNDIAERYQQFEYNSLAISADPLVTNGIDKYNEFVDLYNQINNLQINVLKDHGVDVNTHNDLLFKPKYRIDFSFNPLPYNVDDQDYESVKLQQAKLLIEGKENNVINVLKDIDKKPFAILMKEVYGDGCWNLYSKLMSIYKV